MPIGWRDLLTGIAQAVEQRRACDDDRAVLVVAEDGDPHALDVEAGVP